MNTNKIIKLLLCCVLLILQPDKSIAQPIPIINPQIKVYYKVNGVCVPFEFRTRYNYPTMQLNGLIGYRINQNAEACLMTQPYYDYLRTYKTGVSTFWPSGEYLGKFSQALIQSFNYLHKPEYLIKVREIVDTWIEKQAADGYLGTNNGEGYSLGERWTGWAAWEHKYVLLGLLDYYDASRTQRFPLGEKRVLESAIKLGNLICTTFGDKPGQLDLMETYNAGMAGGSLLEPMTYLYQYTGDSKYLEFCRYIMRSFEQKNGPRIISELVNGSGKVNYVGTGEYRENGKGYEMLSCIIGILRMYQLTGEAIYLKTAEIAWEDIVKNLLYITGTGTQDERFGKDHFLPADEKDKFAYDLAPEKHRLIEMGEGCVTAHWIFLGKLLYQLTGELHYIDEIEKSTLNHLFGSQHPKTGHQCYYMALIGDKDFQYFSPYNGKAPCCVSSVSRCISTLPEVIWTKFSDHGCALLLYDNASVLGEIKTNSGEDVQVTIKTVSSLYSTGKVNVTVGVGKKATFKLGLRVPVWCKGFTAKTNDGKTLTGKPGEMLTIIKEWNGQETIELQITGLIDIIDGSPTYKNHLAFKYGPYVLALDQKLNQNIDIEKVTVTANLKLEIENQFNFPNEWVGELAFSTLSPDGKKLILVPFMDAGQTGSKIRVWIPLTQKR